MKGTEKPEEKYSKLLQVTEKVSATSITEEGKDKEKRKTGGYRKKRKELGWKRRDWEGRGQPCKYVCMLTLIQLACHG